MATAKPIVTIFFITILTTLLSGCPALPLLIPVGAELGSSLYTKDVTGQQIVDQFGWGKTYAKQVNKSTKKGLTNATTEDHTWFCSQARAQEICMPPADAKSFSSNKLYACGALFGYVSNYIDKAYYCREKQRGG